MSLSLDGIGVALSSKDGYSVVERIIPGGATDKTDALEPGDKIIAVRPAGRGSGRHRRHGAARRGRDDPRRKRGTTVELTVLRKSDTTDRFEVAIQSATRSRSKTQRRPSRSTKRSRSTARPGETRGHRSSRPSTATRTPSKRQSHRDVRDLLRQASECGKGRRTCSSISLAKRRREARQRPWTSRASSSRKATSSRSRTSSHEVQVHRADQLPEDIGLRRPARDPDLAHHRLGQQRSSRVPCRTMSRAVIVGDDHTFGKGHRPELRRPAREASVR